MAHPNDPPGGYTHVIVHDGKIIGFACDLRPDGDIVTAFGRLIAGNAPPQTLLMHNSWLRPIRLAPGEYPFQATDPSRIQAAEPLR